MANAFIRGGADGVGKAIDCESVTVDAILVHRERARVSGDGAAELADVKAAAPAAGAYGLVTRSPEPGAAALSSVAQSASTGVLLAANPLRRGFVIVNENDVADLFVAFAATASASVYTRKLLPGETWERRGGYTGAISGIWSAGGSGNARVTEES